jgi:hypothetical protein
MFNWLRRRAPEPPVPPGGVTRDLRGEGWHVRLDLAPQVLSLAIPEAETTWQKGEEALAPTCPVSHDFVSASMLAVKAKLFDDGLYAAAETAAQPDKAKLLAGLVGVAPPIAAAARLGGMDVPLSAEARRLTDEFLADELESKPLGFYSWSDPLRRIFQQDRLLQRALTPADAAALVAALDADPALKVAYGKCLDVVSRLTNPLVAEKPDLRRPAGAWFFPPSRSHESELVTRLYGDKPIPDGFSLADEMVERLRAGSLRLEPTDTSGWYDLQTWALEPLVLLDRMPEGARLTANSRYREQLQELFKAILSLTRETHVKQLEIVPAGAAGWGQPDREVIVWVVPELTVEPVRTYYQRRARGYEFVRQVLESSGRLTTMRRLTPGGPVSRSLDEELAGMTALFRGAAAVTGHELGMEPATDPEAGGFRHWAQSPDIAEDIRMMVPVFYDVGRRKTKVWAILGWATRELVVSFGTPPAAQVLNGRVKIRFGSIYRKIAYPVFAEAYVSRLLDRDEFRAHCERYKTRDRILQDL